MTGHGSARPADTPHAAPRPYRAWSIIAAVLLSALMLAACGEGDGGQSQDDPSPAEEQQTTEPDSPEPTQTSEPTEPTEPDAFEQLVEAAQAEGEVIVYAAYPDEVMLELAEGFTAEYGIEVVHQRSVTAENYARVEQEVASGRLRQDVMTLIDDPAWYAEYDAHLAELDSEELPNVAALPEQFRAQKSLHVYQSYYGLVYNTDELTESDIPEDFRELLDDPRLDGRVATTHPSVSNAFVVWHALQVEHWGQDAHQSFWEGFFEDLGGRVSDSVAPLVNQIAAGELLLMGPTHWGQVGPLHAEGAPVGIVYREPVMSLGSGIVAFAEGPNPNAAKLLIDWLLGESAQQIFCGNGQCASHLEIEGAVPTPEGVELISPDMAMGATLGPDYVVPLFNELAGGN